MFRTLAFPSFHVLGVAFTMRLLPRDRAQASEETKNVHNHRGIGLLSGIEDANISIYYSRKLDLKTVSNLLNDKGYIYKSALDDVGGDESKFDEYLSEIMAKKKDFMNKKIVWNRDALKETLEAIVENEEGGTFACLLGGKSSGKSLVLYDMEGRKANKMFLVDLRDNPNIFTGLLDVLQNRKDSKYEDLYAEMMPSIFDAFAMKIGIKSNTGKSSFRSLYDLEKGRLTLQNLLYRMLDKIPGVFTIVIDEANIAFTLSGTANEQQRKEAMEALEIFTKLTKQTKKASHLF